MIITSNQYPSKEQLENDIATYKLAIINHASTINEPAPLPPNDLVEYIVKNNIEWEWRDITEAEKETNIPKPLAGFEFVSDMYNDFLSKKFYYDEMETFQRERAKAYPPIGDQLDALFKAGLFPEEMAAKIQSVKDTYPKPEENLQT